MSTFSQVIKANASSIGHVIDFDKGADKLLAFDFTKTNTELTDDILDNTDLFSAWVEQKIAGGNARYGIGGYDEHRTIYSRSNHFDTGEVPRRLHLGVDIWAPVGTPIFNFYEAKVHSFAINDNYGDYGATIILSYNIDGFTFNVLYGHLSLNSLNGLEKVKLIAAGAQVATLGTKEENGYWPPHLHFQVIQDMGSLTGDYPGVCKLGEREKYLSNCPDANLILNYSFY